METIICIECLVTLYGLLLRFLYDIFLRDVEPDVYDSHHVLFLVKLFAGWYGLLFLWLSERLGKL